MYSPTTASLRAGFVLPLLFLGAAGHSIAVAQSAGAFTATGNMTTERVGHTATLLLDGTVLIAGGHSGIYNQLLASTEIYDPEAGTFTVSGYMNTHRSFHTATLLPNGKVLIAGGVHFNVALASAELYDPATGTFTATGDMTMGSALHSATLLNNGQVLIAGSGNVNEFDRGGWGELYDASAGKFAATGRMTSPQDWPTATLLADGSVLLANPNYFPNSPLALGSQPQSLGAKSEVYSPLTGTFRLNSNGDAAYTSHTATLLPSGKVLLAGGAYSGIVLASTLLYDPASSTFTPAASMTTQRSEHTAHLLSDGTVLITGGTSAIAEVYAPQTGTFIPTGTMTTSRTGHTTTLLNNGDVLITGGNVKGRFFSNTALASAELYHPAVLVSVPRLFSLSGDGNGQGEIWHSETGLLVLPDTPAAAGEVLSMFTTSLIEEGVLPPRVAIGGKFAETLSFGEAAGYPGLNQVDFRVPEGISPGASVSVRLTYLGRSSNEVTLAVR